MPRQLSDEQKQLLKALPNDGTAIGGYSLFQQLQEEGWRTSKIKGVMAELQEMGEIIVGRGGTGGSIRHVRNDRRALLDAILEFDAEGWSCTRQSLQRHMNWHPDYLEQVLQVLVEKQKIVIHAGGGGGVIALHEDDLEDGEPSDPEDDDRKLLEMLKEEPHGVFISNARLYRQLEDRYGWSPEKYWETRTRLRQRELIEVGRGRGGSVRLVQLEDVVLASKEIVEVREPEPQGRDEELWRRLPDSGEPVTLALLQSQLGWSTEQFFGTLERLVTQGRVSWHRSRVNRLSPDEAHASSTPPDASSPEPSAPPAGAATPAQRSGALYQFVYERFTVNMLRIFLERTLAAPEISQSLEWNRPWLEVASEACSQLERMGYIDGDFFGHLRRHFVRLHPQIDTVARMWLSS